MKKKIKWLVVGCSVFLLVACSQKSSESEKVADTKTSTAVIEEKASPEEQYASVIERFGRLFASGYDVLQEIAGGLDSEEVEVMHYIADMSSAGIVTGHYAFYDINQDGTDELLIGNADGLSAIYTLKDGKPVFVKGAGVPQVGGLRSILTIFQDGLIMYVVGYSTDPNWHALAYQIQSGEIIEVKQREFTQFQGIDPVEVLEISSERVDLTTLAWTAIASTAKDEEATTSETAVVEQADVAAIFAGDTTSIEGTWTNSKGETVTIADGQISYKDRQVPFEVSPFINNTELPLLTLQTGEYSPYGEFAYLVMPAGNAAYLERGESDITKDRIIAAPTVVQAAVISPDAFFYRN